MYTPQFKISDTLNINSISSSSSETNMIAYTLITSYSGDSNTSSSVWKLPLPTNIAYDSQYNWSNESVGQFTNELINQASDIIKNGGDLSSLNPWAIAEKGGLATIQYALPRLLSNFGIENSTTIQKAIYEKAGVSYNPNEQLFFDGVGLRDFTYDFSLAPTSKTESKNIKEGLKKLLTEATPDLKDIDESKGFFFTYPSKFDVKIMIKDFILLERKELRITSINCNLNPDGPLTWHDDNMPTSISLSIGFKESTIITKKNMKNVVLLGD